MNRIQFQRGMSMREFQRSFGNVSPCAAALELSRWPEGFVCPRCESSAHCVLLGRRHKMFQCNVCASRVLTRLRGLCLSANDPAIATLDDDAARRLSLVGRGNRRSAPRMN
jgi:hypothetical protein